MPWQRTVDHGFESPMVNSGTTSLNGLPMGKQSIFSGTARASSTCGALHFDPTKGMPQGEPFPVTSFDNPSLMIPRDISPVDISLNEDRLVLPLAQVSGSIWILDNVDR